MAQHTHSMGASVRPGGNGDPGTDKYLGNTAALGLYVPPANLTPMAAGTLQLKGGGQAHNNLQPYLALNFIIALVGLYPQRG